MQKSPGSSLSTVRRVGLRLALAMLGGGICLYLVGFTGSKDGEMQRVEVKTQKKLSFNRDIQPILATHCFHCHGPDKGARKADMRLDIPDHVFGKSKSGITPIVKGDPDASEIIKRMTAHDPGDIMPPPDAPEKPVSPAEAALVKQWIKEGAEYQPHWSFIPPVKPPVPQVSDPTWPKNDIDRFVMAKLDGGIL